jgi:hypothetical protein
MLEIAVVVLEDGSKLMIRRKKAIEAGDCYRQLFPSVIIVLDVVGLLTVGVVGEPTGLRGGSDQYHDGLLLLQF